MRVLFILIGMVVIMFNAPAVNAQSELKKEVSKEKQVKKRRRARVLICEECGRPETECKCDHAHEKAESIPEGHSADDGHNH